ncbi:CD166 antigen homolog A isoform X1 [Paramormyrops kingsleyae]|uniref:CD166 antigen homolog A isoform X1 n=2 Tax=Paramormyrops kingsleyae TaxID=1676925 RepID=UPI003B970618
MSSPICFLCALFTLTLLLQVSSLQTITALYGETIVVPCNPTRGTKSANLMFTKWTYEKDDGSNGDLLVKQSQKDEVTIQATGIYKDRVNMASNFSLLISRATLADQKTFTCINVGETDIEMFSTQVQVYKTPSPPQIKDKVKVLEKSKLIKLGECLTQDANPAANVTWLKNGQPLTADGKSTVITTKKTADPTTGLSTTSSTLEYMAVKEDASSQFSCSVQHILGPNQVTAPENFTINYPTEKVELQVVSKGPFKEGDNITLKCNADGNPPPTSFSFYLKEKKVTVENANMYTLTGVTRGSTGEYKCSLVNDDKMADTKNILVNYLDVSLSPSGTIIKNIGESLEVVIQKNASDEIKVSWTKDNGKLDKKPVFLHLKYSDSGFYVCEVSTGMGIKQSRSFQLVVEGKPVINRLLKMRGGDGRHKVLICEAEGAPRPSVHWSINGTHEESSYVNGKLIHKLTVVPAENLTVTCMVSNKLGEHMQTINVSSLIGEESGKREGSADDADDQAKLIVGVVVGLLLAAGVVGLLYWIYIKKSKRGSWKTGEKESGTSEESRKLEENQKLAV